MGAVRAAGRLVRVRVAERDRNNSDTVRRLRAAGVPQRSRAALISAPALLPKAVVAHSGELIPVLELAYSSLRQGVGVFMDVLLGILTALVDGWAVTGSWKWAVVLVVVGAMILVAVMAIR